MIWAIATRSISPQPTMNRMAAIAGTGNQAASGAASSAIASRMGADRTAAMGERAPASKLMPLRLKLPLLG
jgi:hypothetical protein